MEPIAGMTLPGLKRSLSQFAASEIRETIKEHGSLDSLPKPECWFTRQSHVNDTVHSKLINMIRAGNLGLGNLRKNRFGVQWRDCPWCESRGIQARLRESHVILLCRANRGVRLEERILRNNRVPLHEQLKAMITFNKRDWMYVRAMALSIGLVRCGSAGVRYNLDIFALV